MNARQKSIARSYGALVEHFGGTFDEVAPQPGFSIRKQRLQVRGCYRQIQWALTWIRHLSCKNPQCGVQCRPPVEPNWHEVPLRSGRTHTKISNLYGDGFRKKVNSPEVVARKRAKRRLEREMNPIVRQKSTFRTHGKAAQKRAAMVQAREL